MSEVPHGPAWSADLRLQAMRGELEAIPDEPPNTVVALERLGVRSHVLLGIASTLPDQDSTLQYAVRVIASSCGAAFGLVGEPDEQLEVHWLNGAIYRRNKASLNPVVHGPNAWLRGLAAAQIARDGWAARTLVDANLEQCRAALGPEATIEASWLHMDALKAFHDRASDTPGRLLAALEACESGNIPQSFQAVVTQIKVPSILVLLTILKQDHAGYEEAMTDALELHRAYWSAPGHDYDFEGYVSLELMALASRAFDLLGWRPPANHYLPVALLERFV